MADEINASPAKEFFIRMITRDIALDDCLLDLVDNSIDGAKRIIEARGSTPRAPGIFEDFEVALDFSPESFKIKDNCGGIPIEEAKDYAFRFGRKFDPDRQPEDSIGIYGIGMKRAMFKIGRVIKIRSSTDEEKFVVDINVDEWERKDEWTFALKPDKPLEESGTLIKITELNRGARADFGDDAFANRLRATIARDYSLFIQKGLSIRVNSAAVPPLEFSLRRGGAFEPAKIKYEDRVDDDAPDVFVELAAGMAAPPPDPDEDLAQIDYDGVDRFGWFVLCNDRVVLAGDKSDRTVWGDDNFTRWHPQYNGFLGIAQFYSEDPAALPWTTTKRDVDDMDPVYRRAVTRMKELTTPYIDYTNARRDNPEQAKRLESETESRRVAEVEERAQMKVPEIARTRVKMGNVQYRKPVEELRRAGEAFGNPEMSYKDVGRKTFEYFYEREAEE